MARSPAIDLLFRPLRAANRLLGRASAMRLMREANLYPWQLAPAAASTYRPGTLPPGAAEELVRDNPRLVELDRRYRAFDRRVTTSPVWSKGTLSDVDLVHFRGHNHYTDQLSGLHANALTYALTYYALKASPVADLLARIQEDGAFGVNLFEIDGRAISRDVLDSAREIEFIRRHVGWDSAPLTMLDIGAGFGRLVHRIGEIGGDRVNAYATDGYAPSTFLCEYYLRFRGAPPDRVVPLDEIEAFLARRRVDLATNIHSFSECSAEAIDWWVSRLAANKVRFLMLIPNRSEADSGAALTNINENIDAICAAHGYRVSVREPAHTDPAVQQFAVDPSVISLYTLGV